MSETAIIVDMPQVYDPDLDLMRRVTQADVNLLTSVAALYGRVSAALRAGDHKTARRLAEEHHESRSAA